MDASAYLESSLLMRPDTIKYLTIPESEKSLRVTETLRDDKIDETQGAMWHVIILRMLIKLQLGISTVLIPIYSSQRYGDISATMIGLIMGIYQAGSATASILSGLYSKDFGHKNTYFLGVIMFIIFQMAFLMSFWTDSVSLFYFLATAARILSGMGEGFVVNASYSIPTSQLPHMRDNYTGLIQIFDLLGAFIGLIYSSIFSIFLDYPGVMTIVIFQVLIYAPFAYFFIPNRFNEIKTPEIFTGQIDEVVVDEFDELKYKDYLMNATSLISIISGLFAFIMQSQVVSVTSLTLSEEGISESVISILTMCSYLIAITVVFLIKKSIRSYQPQNVRTYGFINILLVYWVLFIFKGIGSIIFAMFLLCLITPITVLTGILDQIAGTEQMVRQKLKDEGKDPDRALSITLEDKAISWLQFVMDIGITFGPMIGGAIYDAVGQDLHQAGLWYAAMSTFLVLTYTFFVYYLYRDTRIKNYDTLDGLKSPQIIPDKDKSNSDKGYDAESQDLK